MGLARAASYVPCHDAELLSARDNLGSVPAFDEKGRAANRELLAQCRRAAALQLASGIAWRQRHVEGARNAADYMSRAADRGLLQPGQVWRGPRGRLPTGRLPDRHPARGTTIVVKKGPPAQPEPEPPGSSSSRSRQARPLVPAQPHQGLRGDQMDSTRGTDPQG
eukprot:6836391-Pyramimonas_sp.AAC.1